MKTNVLYYVGRPEVSRSGRFGRRVTRYITAIKGEDGVVNIGSVNIFTNGKMAIPKNVIHVSKSEFKKLVSEEDYKKLRP
jgi:hypothetical protein